MNSELSKIYNDIKKKDWLYYNNYLRFAFIDKLIKTTEKTHIWQVKVGEYYVNPFDINTKELAEEALKAGAIRAGLSDLMTEIENGFLDFDYCIATPSVMKNLSKVAKKLGPRGLMPNPKLGNITDDVITVLNQARKGKVNLKNDKSGIIHACVGKINFNNEDLIANIKAVINTIKEAKPEVVKGKFIKSVYLSTTMGPSVAVKLETLL